MADTAGDDDKGRDDLAVTDPVDEGDEGLPPQAEPPVEQFSQTIKGIQIFRAGTWNGRTYTVKDIDGMIKAAATIGFKPPVKLGHTNDPGAPAYGYVTNLRREGETLLADFEHVPDELVAQIRERRYDQVSSEILLDFDHGGTKYRRALRAVAVLGAHAPGVANLKPLSEFLSLFTAADRYETIIEETPEMTTKADPAGTNPNAPDHTAEIAQLQAALAANEAKLAELASGAKAAETLQLKLQEADEREKRHAKMFADLAQRTRTDQIEGLVKSLSRPVYRNNVRALAELALRATESGAEPMMVAFAANDEVQPTDTDAFGVLTDLVRKMNQDVALLTSEHIRSDPTGRRAGGGVDDPAVELLSLIGDYKRAHPGVSDQAAKDAIIGNPKYRDVITRLNNVARMAN